MADRILLQRSKKKDEIAVGFKRDAQNSRPILEHIGRLAGGKAPNLKVKCAFEIDGRANTSYDYVTRKTTPCPNAGASGSFMLLACTADGIKPSELLQPVYDFCQRLDRPPHIWYSPEGTASKGEYEIAEARVGYLPLPIPMDPYSKLTGTYYVSDAKILLAIEKLTRQPMDGGNGEIRDMVEKDAYLFHEKAGFETPELNWRLAQRGLVSKIICNMRKDTPWKIKISGHLRTNSPVSELIDEVKMGIIYINLLRELKGDDSIHLVSAAAPVWVYINNYLTMGQ